MKYDDQLKTSAWMRTKYEILKRDNFVCSKCLCDNSESQLEVHHILYLKNRMAWDYPDFYLVTLCRRCHQLEHDHDNINHVGEIIRWVKKLF